MRRHRTLAVVSALASLAAVGVLWFLFAPSALGGRVDYAVVYGSSMEPTLHSGDLVVLRSRPSYAVGEVVGYRNADLHRVVLHRVVGEERGHFLFKGDNNGSSDSYRAPSDRIVGRLWLRVPAVGNVFTWLRTPWHALLVIVFASLLLAGGEVGRRRLRREPGLAADAAWQLVGGGAVGIALFGAVALLGATHAQTRPVTRANAYAQHVSFGYFGKARPGTVYPSGRVRTGDTVFTQLVHRLTLTADYRFSSALAHQVRGTAGLAAKLRSQQGFERTLRLTGRTQFAGDRWHASGTLDLIRLRKAIAAYERTTGIVGDSYTIDVAAHVAVQGVVGGRRVHELLAPTPVSFALDSTKLKLLLPEQPDAPDPLQATVAGSLAGSAPASIGLGGLRLSVRTARTVGVLGAVGAVLVAVLGLLLVARGRGGDEVEQIRRRYRSWLVEAASPLSAPNVVDLTSIESLARLAEYYERAIVHHADGAAHTFAIEHEGTLYRVRLGAEVHQLEWPALALRQESR